MTQAQANRIEVVEYDAAWPGRFRKVHAFVWPAISEVAVRIDHVGSTAVPGLAAKPIIDMDIVVNGVDRVDAATERLVGSGYSWVGDLGVVGREAFEAPAGDELPDHHLYLVVENNKAHLDHLLLRDLLLGDAGARARYADLKRHNATVAKGDLGAYTAMKASFVAELLTRAREERGLAEAEYWIPTEDELTPRA